MPRTCFAVLLCSSSLLIAQQPAPPPGAGYVTSTYTFVETIGNNGRGFVQFVATYPDTLAPEDYPGPLQIAADAQQTIRNFPNRAVGPEGFATAVAKALLDKYGVMSGVRVILAFGANSELVIEAQRYPVKTTPAAKEALRSVPLSFKH